MAINEREIAEDWLITQVKHEMKEKLILRRSKGSWKGMSVTELFRKLLCELIELNQAIDNGDKKHIISECADVCNYAGMIIDNLE